MDLTYLPQQHGSRLSYLQALSSAILVPDPIDKELISARLRREGTTWEIRLRTAPKWIWRRCKRRVAEPEELFELLSEVFRIFGSIKDAKKGTPLFNLAAWKMVKNMLDLVVEGSISDPPETPLYYCLGSVVDVKGISMMELSCIVASEGQICWKEEFTPTSGRSGRLRVFRCGRRRRGLRVTRMHTTKLLVSHSLHYLSVLVKLMSLLRLERSIRLVFHSPAISIFGRPTFFKVLWQGHPRLLPGPPYLLGGSMEISTSKRRNDLESYRYPLLLSSNSDSKQNSPSPRTRNLSLIPISSSPTAKAFASLPFPFTLILNVDFSLNQSSIRPYWTYQKAKNGQR